MKFFPSALNGEIYISGSKSVLHRLLIASALSDGDTEICNLAQSDDITVTVDAISLLNLKKIEIRESYLLTNVPSDKTAGVLELNMRECGSSLRFLLPVVAALGLNVRFIGEGRLPERPLSELIEVLSLHGIVFDGDTLPFTLSGKLKSGDYKIQAGVSSQYISGLLFALPLLNGDSTLQLVGEAVSSGYLDLTLTVLQKFNIKIERKKDVFYIKGGQKYISPKKIFAEGDWSSACFFAVGAALTGKVVLNGMNSDSLQSDRIIADLLDRYGAEVVIKDASVTILKKEAKALNFSASDCPDIVPIMAVALSVADGVSSISGVDRLRFKESDRLKAVTDMLCAFGAECEYIDGALIIKGVKKLKPAFVDGKNDHRIVMSAAIAALIAEGETEISDTEAVNKSYRSFFKEYAVLGGKYVRQI